MQGDATYYREHEAEDAMSVMARWMGQNSKIQVVYHDGTAVDADIFTGRIRVPRLACASGITQEALMLLREQVYHEAGHIDETKLPKSEYPKGALFEIWNALEDRRMEAVEAGKHKGCEIVFRWAKEHYNRKIAAKMSEGKMDMPLWEALAAMSFMVEGTQPAWRVGRKAQDYVDAAYGEFGKVKQCRNAREALDLARVIYKLLKDVNDEWKKSEPPKPKPDPKQDKPKKGQPQQGESQEGEDGKPQQGGQKDFDDYEDEKPGKGNGKEPGEDDSDGGEDEGDGEDGKDEEGDEGKDDKGKEGDEDEDEDEDGKDGEGGNGKDGDDSEESDDGGKNQKGEGSDGDSEVDAEDGSDGGNGPSSKGIEGDEGEEQSGDPDGDVKPGDVPYDPKNEEPKGGKGDGKDKRDLEDECDGLSREQAMNEDLEEFFKNMPAEDKQYTSRRDLDEHSSPPTSDEDKTSYRERLSQVSVAVSSMTRALEQALRSLSKARKNPYLRSGRIDKQRLVAIAKNLSREVFYRVRDGMTLDVAVAITIDESGSMSNYYEVQLLAMAIGEALNAIRIPFEIIGTTTKYGGGDRRMPPMDDFSRVNPIIYRHYKLFSEQWANVRHRMVHTRAHHHNVDGEVVEYAAFRLQQRPERRKVIFSLSDGEPDAGHCNGGVMRQNLRRVCSRVRKQGVECYGAGIGTETPRTFYGKDWFVYLEEVGKMGPEFVRMFARVVTQGRVKV